MARRLTFKQREAVAMLHLAASQGREPHGVVCLQAEPTGWIDGQVWVNAQTALALQRRGLGRITYYPPDGAEINLTQPEPDSGEGHIPESSPPGPPTP